MAKNVAQIIFNLIIIIILLVAIYASWDWPEETRLFPRAITLPTLALSAISLIIGLLRARRERVTVKRGMTPDDHSLLVKTTGIFGWLIFFGLAVWSLGLPTGVPLFVFFYMIVRLAAESRLMSESRCQFTPELISFLN